MKKIIAVVLALMLMLSIAAMAESYVIGARGDSNLRVGPGLDYEKTGVVLRNGETIAFTGDIVTDGRGVDWYSVAGGVWVSSRYTDLHIDETDYDEPTEGAPVMESERRIDAVAIDPVEIAGLYKGTVYPTVDLNMYTSAEDNELGLIAIQDASGAKVYEGTVIGVMDNYYEILGMDVSFTVYTENGAKCLDLWVNGAHVDNATMMFQYVS